MEHYKDIKDGKDILDQSLKSKNIMRNCFVLIAITLASCGNSVINSQDKIKDSLKKNAIHNNAENALDIETSKRLDLFFSCDEFAYFVDCFRIPYNGCTFGGNDTATNLGWADVVLFINKNDRKYYENLSAEEMDKELVKINKMSSDKLKTKFRPFIFLIEKKYLEFHKDLEIQYYPKFPCVKKMFEFDSHSKQWLLIDSFNVLKEGDDYVWVDNKLKEIAGKER